MKSLYSDIECMQITERRFREECIDEDVFSRNMSPLFCVLVKAKERCFPEILATDFKRYVAPMLLKFVDLVISKNCNNT